MGRRAHIGRTASNPKSFRLEGMASCATPDGRAPSQSRRRRAGAPNGRRRAPQKTQIKQAQFGLAVRSLLPRLAPPKRSPIPPCRELSLANSGTAASDDAMAQFAIAGRSTLKSQNSSTAPSCADRKSTARQYRRGVASSRLCAECGGGVLRRFVRRRLRQHHGVFETTRLKPSL